MTRSSTYKDLQNLEDLKTIQDDMNKLCQWTIKWLMLFNADNCKVMHIGKDNPRFEYEMTDTEGNTKVLKSVEVFHFFTTVRSSGTPIAFWILLRTSSFVTCVQKSPIASHLKGMDPSLDFCCQGPALTGVKEGG